MDTPEQRLDDDSRVWDEFCDALKAAKAEVLNPVASSDPVSRAEGWRYLTRLTRLSLDWFLENADPDFPMFFHGSHSTAKIGADSPDNTYWNATIRGDRDYRITGRLGEAIHFSIGTKANRYATDGTMASTGEINGKDIKADANGYFEIIASQTPKPGNWLPLSADSSMVLVREMFRDTRTDRRAEVKIERIGGPPAPTPLRPETLEPALKNVAAFVRGTAKTFNTWSELFKQTPNILNPAWRELSQQGGGDPAIDYLHGYWRLAPGEALLIESEVPECLFWNFQLDNWWMESLDYRYSQIWVNKFHARYEPDGRVRIIVAERDPGVGNFIDTAGHSEGTMLLRWVHADRHPVPTCKVVKLDELRR